MNEIRKDAVVRGSVSFFVEGPPVPKGRPRLAPNGHTYTPKRTRDYEDAIGWAWKEATSRRPFAGPVSVSLHVDEKSAHPADLDNIVKAYLDALNGLAWEDDKQVTVLFAVIVRDAKEPGVNVVVRECRASRVTVKRKRPEPGAPAARGKR